MLRLKIVYIIFIALFCKAECQSFLVTRNDIDNKTYCVTNSKYALSWIREKSFRNRAVNDQYIFNWNSENSLDGRFSKVILDRRWEDMETIIIDNKNYYTKDFDYKIVLSALNDNFTIPLSIRAEKEAHIFLCDGPSPPKSNCYWIMLQTLDPDGTRKSKIQKCKKNEIPYNAQKPVSQCFNTLTEIRHRSSLYISDNFWSHFLLNKKENDLFFTYVDGNVSERILETTDNTINVTHFIIHSKIVRSFWKIHELEYMVTRNEGSFSVWPIPTKYYTNNQICISFFLSMCETCKLKLTLKDSENTIAFEKEYKANDTEFEITFATNEINYSSDWYNDYSLNILTTGLSDEKFWAINNLRPCQSKNNELRNISSNQATTCQLMFGKNNTISLQDTILQDIKDDCPIGYFGDVHSDICVPYRLLYHKNKPIGSRFCSKYAANEQKCSCMKGYTIESKCTERCPRGFYGHNCIEKCECNNQRAEDCNFITGKCFQCPQNYTGIKCEIPLTPIEDVEVYFKNESVISLRWKPYAEIINQEGATVFKLTNYVIKYFDNFTNSRIIFVKNSCTLWPELQCAQIEGLRSNTKYTININVAYIDTLDGNRTDNGPFTTVQAVTTTEPSQAPYDLKVNWTQENLLQVEWKHPNNSNGNIIFFKIEIFTFGFRQFLYYYPVDTCQLNYRSVIPYRMEPSKYYLIEISAFNGHEGEKSEITIFTPPEITTYSPSEIPTLCEELQIFTCGNDIKVKGLQYFATRREETVYLSISITGNEYSVEKEINLNHMTQNYFCFEDNDCHENVEKCYPWIKTYNEYDAQNYKVTIDLETYGEKMHSQKYIFYYQIYIPTNKICIIDNSYNNLWIILVVFGITVIVQAVALFLYRKKKLNIKNSPECQSDVADTTRVQQNNNLSNQEDRVTEISECTASSENVVVNKCFLQDFENYLNNCEKSGLMEKQHSDILGDYYKNKVYQKLEEQVYIQYVDMMYTPEIIISKAYLVMNSLNNFWNVVCNENIENIVLHGNIEGDSFQNCWPDLHKTLNFQDISVRLDYQQIIHNFSYKSFTVTYQDRTRHIQQIHLPYTGINPSKYVPFIKQMQTIALNSSSPILVLSREGIDKAGLIVLCDMTIKMAEKNNIINLKGNLQELAKYDKDLAGNFIQYRFAHLIILKYFFDEKYPEDRMSSMYDNY